MEVLQRTANRGSISTGYDIDNSVKLEPDNSEFLSRTIGSTSNRKTFTVSCWFKRTELKAGAANANGHMLFMSGVDAAYMVSMVFHTWQDTYADTLEFRVDGANNNNTTRRFRDTSAWYHIVLAVDTTQATEANRWKLYVNGVQETSFSQTSYPSQNADTYNNVANSKLRIGSKWYAGSESGYFAGYIADYYHIDGEALAPTDFGEFDEDSGIWKPKAYTGSFGTNGWYLDFADGADLGDDESGNSNDFTENNITAADQAVDTPTNNFCTLVGNQQFVPSKATTLVREGGTIMHGGQNSGAYSTMGVRSGKWYFESTLLHSGGVGTENHGFGVIAANRLYEMNINGEDIGADVGGWACAGNANPRNNNAGASGANYLTSPAINKVLGCAIDMDNGKIWWHNEGTWHSLNNTVGNPATGVSPAWSNLLTATDDFVLPAAGLYANGAGPERAMNFGGYALPVFTAVGTYSDANGYGSFAYAPPTGYYALCTKNLAEYG